MEENKTGKKKTQYYILAILIVTVLVVSTAAAGDSGSPFGRIAPEGELLRFNGWTRHTAQGEVPLELPCYLWLKNASCSITNTLPMALGQGTYLAFESSGSIVRVYISGECVYSNEEMFMRTVRDGSVYNYVPMDIAYAGASIAIEFEPVEPYFSGALPRILLGTRAELLMYAKSMDSYNMQMSYSVTFLGLIVILLSITVFSYERSFGELLILGFYLTLCGITLYITCRGYVSYRTGAEAMVYAFFDRSFLFLPVIFTFYCMYRSRDEKPRMYRALILAGSLWFVGASFLLSFCSDMSLRMLRDADYIYVILMYAMCMYKIMTGSGERRYTVLNVAAILPIVAGAFLEGLTHAGFSSGRRISPFIAGMLISSVMLTFNAALALHRHYAEQLEMEKELSESRMRILLDQMKSHFIRNCITTIRAMIKFEPDKAYDLMHDFSEYITYNIDSIRSPKLIPLEKEINHIEAYVNLELERLSPRLSVEYDFREKGARVPQLSIEPFVENAVKHGIWPKRGPGTVWVSSVRDDDTCIITVRDDGVGFDTSQESAEERYGIGIGNAVERLREMAGGSVEIEGKKDEGTVVTIRIPLNGNEDAD